MECAVCVVHVAVWSVQCAVCSVKCVYCVVYRVQCAVWPQSSPSPLLSSYLLQEIINLCRHNRWVRGEGGGHINIYITLDIHTGVWGGWGVRGGLPFILPSLTPLTIQSAGEWTLVSTTFCKTDSSKATMTTATCAVDSLRRVKLKDLQEQMALHTLQCTWCLAYIERCAVYSK